MSSISELYSLVTKAILDAERAESAKDDLATSRLYLEVSLLEEGIAEQVAAGCYEGAVARRGAIRAALKSGQYQRALELSERYLKEAPQDLKVEIEELIQNGQT